MHAHAPHLCLHKRVIKRTSENMKLQDSVR